MRGTVPAGEAPWLDRYLAALLTLGSVLGLAATVIGLVKGSLVYALTVAGAVGVYGFLISFVLLRFAERSRWAKSEHRPYIEYGSIFVGASLALTLFLILPPTREETDDFSLLTVLGIAFVVGFFVLTVHTVERWRKQAAPARKRCPDCAEEVLAAAKVCKHCGFRFEPPAQPPPPGAPDRAT